MGTILTGYGDTGYDHEGYAGQLLDDGSITSTYSNQTMPRMVGVVVAACTCGWMGITRYPTTIPGRWDEAAEERALAEWEHQHAVPALRTDAWERLRAGVRRLAESHATTTRTRFSALTPAEQRDVLDRTLTELKHAMQLAGQLRRPLNKEGECHG